MTTNKGFHCRSGTSLGEDLDGLPCIPTRKRWERTSRKASYNTEVCYENDQTTDKAGDGPAGLTRVWLRIACNFDTEQAVFSWSTDEKEFAPLGDPFTMAYQLITFQGVRFARFNFNTNGQPGGYADFDNFKVNEPRARGIERMIPVGKTITLASGADDTVLAIDRTNRSLVNVAADDPAAVARNTRFQVVGLGKRRIALKSADGRFVSAGDDGVALKDLDGKAPGEAESFQWVNLMRRDTMLMSLFNHRYLATQPNEPGPVRVSGTGPRPDRKGGACFQWKAGTQHW